MRKVLVSLKPYYYYLVGEGIKKIEVRKGMPRASDWNKEVLFYMSKDVKSFAKIPKEFQEKYRKHFGKVGMQFVCDRINEFHEWQLTPQGKFQEAEQRDLELFLQESSLTIDEVWKYRENLPYYKPLYFWHISDLKIYDKPKELSDYIRECRQPAEIECENCPYFAWNDDHFCTDKRRTIIRPPQNWCYVDELEVG